jgi:hypothetical protein
MPKGKNDDVVLDFGTDDERELTGSDANPIDAATGESLFDDLNPRFVRQLDAAVEKVTKKPPKNDAEDDDLDPADEDADDADLDETDDEDADEPAVETDPADEELDPDADEPTPTRKGNPKFEKRLARADRLIEEVRIQNQELAARLNERETSDKLAASEVEFTEFKAETQTKLDALKTKKVKAIDDGDSEAQAAIDEEVIDLKTELRTRQREHEAAKKAVETATKRRGASQITLTKVAQWKRKNPRYERDADFAAAVNGLDAELARGGSNPESDDHYKEIDRRLKKLFPEHGKKAVQRRHPAQQLAREESPSTRRTNGDARVTVRGNKIKISPAKLERVKNNMTRFGLDPSNKKDLQDYILNNPGL